MSNSHRLRMPGFGLVEEKAVAQQAGCFFDRDTFRTCVSAHIAFGINEWHPKIFCKLLHQVGILSASGRRRWL